MLDCREIRTGFNCDSCFELTVEECEPIVISAGLTPSSIYFLHMFDQFDIRRTIDVLTNIDGDFIIDQSLFPDNYFNSFGRYDFFISSDEDGLLISPLTFSLIEYNCVLLNIQGNGIISVPVCDWTRTEVSCDSCYQITVDYCDLIIIYEALIPNTNYFLQVFDQFSRKRTIPIITNISGDFIIDQVLFPNNYFNPFGSYDFYVSSDQEGLSVVQLTFSEVEYPCVVLNIQGITIMDYVNSDYVYSDYVE